MRRTGSARALAVLSGLVAVLTTVSGAGAQSGISAVWANDGGDKVLAEERRASGGMTIAPANGVVNTIWDGNSISLFGARNETVGFNLVIESEAGASGVTVDFDRLSGPGGSVIDTRAARADGVFDYRGRNIELFLVGYLPIKGLSLLSYELNDERWIPSKMRRPFSVQPYGSTWRAEVTAGKTSFKDRPGAGKSFPDIAVPLEARPPFDVPANGNQSVWVDIYIPETVKPGIFKGSITIAENGSPARTLPVSLTVRDFALPHTSASTAVTTLGTYDVSERFYGVKARFASRGTPEYRRILPVLDRYVQMLRRHRVLVMADEGNGSGPPLGQDADRLTGAIYSAARGYAGPGRDTGDPVFFIGPYGSWKWQSGDQRVFNAQTDTWMNWFATHAPRVRKFLYLVDEPNLNDVVVLRKVNGWLDQLAANPGVGKGLPTFLTAPAVLARAKAPRVSGIASWYAVAETESFEKAVAEHLQADPANEFWQYNGKRPASGSFAIEDDGTALRVAPWAAFKKHVSGWFYWSSTYYYDYQNGAGRTDVWRQAKTFGVPPRVDPVLGDTGGVHSNGDGVLLYPGTDVIFPDTPAPGLGGPVASLRLKHWRRGIQDVDYLALAAAKNPAATQRIVEKMVPKVLWEVGIYNPQDPSYQFGGKGDGVGWSTNPDEWEKARAALADIIEGK